MIQVLGLRDWTNPKTGKVQKVETFFGKGWRFNAVQEVFDQPTLDAVLKQIPVEEQFNLYFTVSDCFEESGRKLKEQHAIPFDIDDLDLQEGKELDAAEAAARAASEVLGVPFEDMGVCFSGNGVQFFILTTNPIVSEEYFDQTRAHYGVVAKMIQNKLHERGIKGKVDTSVWSKARLMRLPSTINRKPGRIERRSKILNGTFKPVDFDIVRLSGLQFVEDHQSIPVEALKNYPKPDTPAICTGCKFLQHCKTNQAEITEPQWYGMLSIVARLDNGRELAHEFSSKHPDYNHYETENKIEQTLIASGPRTCKNIESLWDKCHECEYYGKVTSPIMIKSANYIASHDFGFRERSVDKNGNVKAGKPAYHDLVKQFQIENPFRVIDDTEIVYIYDGRKWISIPDARIRNWMMEKVSHKPTVGEMSEFIGILKAHNIISLEEMYRKSEGYIPFKNLVVNRKTRDVYPHSPEYGFTYCLEFDYDPNALAPLWTKFLDDITEGNEEKCRLLEEFAGYCISGDQQWLQKALIMVGDGANGKSVFMEILGEVAGEGAHSTLSMQSLSASPQTRYQLVNKLFNYSEETSIGAMLESDIFKIISVGGSMEVKKLYVQPFTVFSRAKLIISSNSMPMSTDKSHGFYRRLAIVQFNKKFSPGDPGYDPNIKEKLRQELPGIANRLLLAYDRLKERGMLPDGAVLREAVEQYAKESNPVHIFYDQHLEVLPSDDVNYENALEKISEVYEHYRMMCEQSGFKAVNVIQFSKQLTRIDESFKDRRSLVRNGSAVSKYFKGIKLNKEF